MCVFFGETKVDIYVCILLAIWLLVCCIYIYIIHINIAQLSSVESSAIVGAHTQTTQQPAAHTSGGDLEQRVCWCSLWMLCEAYAFIYSF